MVRVSVAGKTASHSFLVSCFLVTREPCLSVLEMHYDKALYKCTLLIENPVMSGLVV